MNHLIYHLYPDKNKFEFHLNYLTKYKNIFNGEKLICVSSDDLNDDLYKFDEIKDCLSDFKMEVIKNDSQSRESNSFFNILLPYILDFEGITFFAHSKSSSPKRRKPAYSAAHTAWTRLLYEKSLENIKEVEDKILHGDFISYGPFLRTEPLGTIGTCKWHYSGTFFWFNNERIKKLSNEIKKYRYKTDRWGVEGFLGSISPIESAYCCFDIKGDLGKPMDNLDTHPLKEYISYE